MKFQSFKYLLGILSIFLSVSSIAEERVDAKKLMHSLLYRYSGETKISTLNLMTCAYGLAEGRAACTSRPRKKKLQQVVKKYGKKLEDSRQFTLIQEPRSEAGISILQYDYDEKDKLTDQWLYLPEIKQIKRVASDRDTPKRGSLFGSEFSLEDIERPKLNDYKLAFLDKVAEKGRNLIRIESVPTKEHSNKTNYSKRIYWVDSERLVIVKTEYFAWDGDLIKVSTAGRVREISGIWTVQQELMRNKKTERVSMLRYSDIVYNSEVPDEVLTQRILSDAVFRNRELRKLSKRKPIISQELTVTN